jgi:peptide/nickel transport system substrate-binding protein
MKKTNRRLEIFALILILSSTAFMSVIAQQTVAGGGTLVLGITNDPPNFNNALSTQGPIMQTGCAVYESLLYYDLNGNAEPFLAKSWSISADGTEFTFKLADNVTFHDGVKMTSKDVNYSIILCKDYHPSGKLLFGDIKSITLPDDYTIVLKYNNPFVPLMRYLTPTYLPILPAHLYENTDPTTNPYNLKPVGTGPFKWANDWVKGDHVTFVKNENYWRTGRPYLDRIIFKVYPVATVGVMALEKGDVQYNFLMRTASEVARLELDPDLKTTSEQRTMLAATGTVMVNLRNPILNNTKVRHALQYAIDQKYICEKVFFNLALPQTSPFSVLLGPDFYNPDLIQYDYNTTKAEQLLDEAGYPRGNDGWRFKLVFICDSTDAQEVQTSTVITEQLKSVGVDIQLIAMEFSAMTARVFQNWDYDLSLNSPWTGPDPAISAGRWLDPKNIKNVYVSNCMAYNNTRVAQLFNDVVKTVDPVQRRNMYYEMQQIIWDDLPCLMVYECTHYRAVWRYKEFGNLPPDPIGGYAYYGDIFKIAAPEQSANAPDYSMYYYIAAAVVVAVVITAGGTYAFVRKSRKKEK